MSNNKPGLQIWTAAFETISSCHGFRGRRQREIQFSLPQLERNSGLMNWHVQGQILQTWMDLGCQGSCEEPPLLSMSSTAPHHWVFLFPRTRFASHSNRKIAMCSPKLMGVLASGAPQGKQVSNEIERDHLRIPTRDQELVPNKSLRGLWAS